ncbi:MAG: CRISPR-associated protein Cas4 [Angelakisella sp.]|nr:CRISPR-associated protein Cas4 [Angelakisella sp.]
MDNDQDFFALSLISQYGYCPRRAGLIFNEQVWQENAETAAGRAQHQNVHDCRVEKRGSLVKLYEHQVYSKTLKLIGKCDCIEATEQHDGCLIPFLEKYYHLYPIEYKHGVVRQEREYELQLCAQAMCLEEMYHTQIFEGAIFYIDAHRRVPVMLDNTLRQEVQETADAIGAMLRNYLVPKANYSPKCQKCSMYDYCMPKTSITAKGYYNKLVNEASGGEAL